MPTNEDVYRLCCEDTLEKFNGKYIYRLTRDREIVGSARRAGSPHAFNVGDIFDASRGIETTVTLVGRRNELGKAVLGSDGKPVFDEVIGHRLILHLRLDVAVEPEARKQPPQLQVVVEASDSLTNGSWTRILEMRAAGDATRREQAFALGALKYVRARYKGDLLGSGARAYRWSLRLDMFAYSEKWR